MKQLFTFILLLLIAPCYVYAQQEGTDTLEVRGDLPHTATPEDPLRMWIERPVPTPETQPTTGADSAAWRFRTMRPTPIIPGQASLARWDHGALIANGQTLLMPGLMSVEEGTLSLRQQWGDFLLLAYGAATHYTSDLGLTTQWGFGGALSYQMTDHIRWTVFGAYHTATGILQPAMAGYIQTPVYGGYIDYRFNTRGAGVKVGAQSYYDPMRRQWEAQPILMPYYRSVSIDLGGILYQAIKMGTSHPGKHSADPTIMPTKVKPIIPPHP